MMSAFMPIQRWIHMLVISFSQLPYNYYTIDSSHVCVTLGIVCVTLGIIIHLPYSIIPSIAATSSLYIQYTHFLWYLISTFWPTLYDVLS